MPSAEQEAISQVCNAPHPIISFIAYPLLGQQESINLLLKEQLSLSSCWYSSICLLHGLHVQEYRTLFHQMLFTYKKKVVSIQMVYLEVYLSFQIDTFLPLLVSHFWFRLQRFFFIFYFKKKSKLCKVNVLQTLANNYQVTSFSIESTMEVNSWCMINQQPEFSYHSNSL